MPDEFGPAVTALKRKLEEQQQTVNETKKAINMLLKIAGKPPQFVDIEEATGIIRADQFYGKPLATAAQRYLELRGQACQPDEIVRGLLEGGFDFDMLGWKENDRVRSLSISLAKNNVKFHRLKNGTYGLREWYDEDFLRERAAAADGPQSRVKKRQTKGRKAKGPKLLPETKSRPAVDQTAQKEVKATM